MVTIVLSLLAILIVWAVMDSRVSYHKEQAEFWEEVYFGMASDNVDLRIQLEDARESYCRIIGRNTMNWAASQVGNGR